MQGPSVVQRYDHIRRISPEFTRRIQTAAKEAHNEAEFEHAMNNAIAAVAGELGVELAFRQEYTLATGRADAVYNRFVIEYEPPGSLRDSLSHGQTRHAVQQTQGYLKNLATQEHHGRDRLLGVALDGTYFVFVRYHDGHASTEQPLAVNRASTERFLRSLFSLSSGRALIPENLVEDFGSQNDYSRQVTRALYNALEAHTADLPGRLYAQWRLFFGEVAGYDAAEGKLTHEGELRQFARGMGLDPRHVDAPRLFFTIHTYFSFLVKNIARLVLEAYAGGMLSTTPLTTVANLQGEPLRRELSQMESGGIFRVLGLKNLLEGDFFSWYLSAWDDQIEEALRLTLGRLADYNPVTIQDAPHSTRDLLKKLYHYLLPREIRHDLGEFYTPDWLAERLLNQLNEPLFLMPAPGKRVPTPNKRLLDPACGSGTFLVLAIRALKANCVEAGLAEGETLDVTLQTVMGIDLNPLAVLAARVNYLLAIADLLPYRRHEIEIPVYLADSILTPAYGEGLFEQNRLILDTAVGKLPIPDVIDTRQEMDRLTAILEEYVTGGFSPQVFLSRCRQELPDVAAHPESETVLTELFERLSELHRQGLDGIWARVLKNAFMPLFLEPFDYVVGNPPWINWESLPQGYRQATANLWRYYGLVATKGKGKEQFELGKQKRDISSLMTYVALDRYLKKGGKLGFVITQSIWKTGASAPFRRFVLPDKTPLRVFHVDDLSGLQVFEGASTRTSAFVIQKGDVTRYPLPYTYWQKKAHGSGLDYDSTLEEILTDVRQLRFQAEPVDADDPTSSWLTARPRALSAIHKVLGPADYTAHAGVVTWANGVYWLKVAGWRPDGLVVVHNVTEGAKREVEEVTAALEPDLLYPLLRGRDIGRWHAAPSAHILLPHTPQTLWRAISEDEMQSRCPKTFVYLYRFRDLLLKRSGYRLLRQGHPFYILSDVNKATFAPWKVVWRYIAEEMTAAVVGYEPASNKLAIPDHRLMIVPLDNESEAHYVVSTLNSSVGRFMVASFVIGTQISAHVLQKIRIPRYEPGNSLHQRLVSLSQRAHELAPRAYAGDKEAWAALRLVEAEVDRAAAGLWGLTEEELRDVEKSLHELRPGRE